MAIRLFDVVLRGEINNSTRNSVFGFFVLSPDFAATRDSVRLGCEILHFSLAGNLMGDLAGRAFRFEVSSNGKALPSHASDRNPRPTMLSAGFSWSQFGVLGEACVRMVREFPPGVSLDSILSGDVKVSSLPLVPSLYFEWFGPNGRIVVEERRPHLIFIDEGTVAASGTVATSGTEETSGANSLEPPTAPPGLMLIDDSEQQMTFENELHHAFAPDNSFQERPEDRPQTVGASSRNRKPRWHITSLVQIPPISMQQVMNLPDHDAWMLLIQILQQLAPFGMALDICPHCSPQIALRLLIFTLLPSTTIPANPPAEGIVLHLSTWDHCPQCLASTTPKRRHRRKQLSVE